MKVLVIGSEGNIGSELVPYLVNMGHMVYRVDIVQKYEPNYFIADIKSVNDLIYPFDKFRPDVVFNLAAMVSRVTCEQSKAITVDTNLSGVQNVIQLCKMYKSKLIYFSTSEVYGNIGGTLSEDRNCKPNNFYGLTKYMGEDLVKYAVHDGLSALIVRPFMFYSENETFGTNRSAMIRFAENLLLRKSIDVHVGAKRSWMHMSDAVVILEKLMMIDKFDTINIGHADLHGMDEIAGIMCYKIGIPYFEYVNEMELPARMTLEKIPAIYKQFYYTNYIPEVSIEMGINRVLTKTKIRLGL